MFYSDFALLARLRSLNNWGLVIKVSFIKKPSFVFQTFQGNGGDAGSLTIRYKTLQGKFQLKSCAGFGAKPGKNGKGGKGNIFLICLITLEHSSNILLVEFNLAHLN